VAVQVIEGGDAGSGGCDGDAVPGQQRGDAAGGEADGGFVGAEQLAQEAAGDAVALPGEGGGEGGGDTPETQLIKGRVLAVLIPSIMEFRGCVRW
jgi:hypothetical protein